MYKTLPDALGYWVADDGQECFIKRYDDGRYGVTKPLVLSSCSPTIPDAVRCADLRPARWQLVEKPKFDPLPSKPLLVFAHEHGKLSFWYRVDTDETAHAVRALSGPWIEARKLTVVPHPDNDPTAVSIIENAIPF